MKYSDMHHKFKIEWHNIIDSTNAEIKRRALHSDEGLVVAAKCQTAGVGRLGRSFYSPDETGLYFSVLLKPDMANEDVALITPLAAVAVCEAIEKMTDKHTGIKWVNDIFVDGKKVCGILTQASFANDGKSLDYVVLGIGVNLANPVQGFGEELSEIAGALVDSVEADFRESMLDAILDRLDYYYKEFEDKNFMREYKNRSIVIGKEIQIVGEDRYCTVKDIDDSGHLVVEYDTGETKHCFSGEISIRPRTTWQ